MDIRIEKTERAIRKCISGIACSEATGENYGERAVQPGMHQ